MKNILSNLKEDETEIFDSTISFREIEFRRGVSGWQSRKILGLFPPMDIPTTTTTYKITLSEDKLKTTRTDLLQLQTERKSHIKMGGTGRDVI